MSNSSSTIVSASAAKTRGTQKRAAAEPIESEPVAKTLPSALGSSEIVQPKENSNDVLVSTFIFIYIDLNCK